LQRIEKRRQRLSSDYVNGVADAPVIAPIGQIFTPAEEQGAIVEFDVPVVEILQIKQVETQRDDAIETSAIPSFFIRTRRSEPRLCFG